MSTQEVDFSGAAGLNTAEMFKFFAEKVKGIDEILDANEDSKNAGKRQAKRQLINKAEETVDVLNGEEIKGYYKHIAEQVVTRLNGYDDPEVKFGMFYGILQELNKAFLEAGDNLLDTIVASMTPSDGDNAENKLAQDAITKMLEQRKSFYEQMKVLQNLNVMMNLGTKEDFPLPTRRQTRATGKRALSLVDWQIDGKPLPVHGETSDLLFLTKRYGYETAKEFRDEMIKQAGVKNFQTLPDPKEEGGPNIIFNAPNGETVTGYKKANFDQQVATPSGEDDDDDTPDESDNDNND